MQALKHTSQFKDQDRFWDEWLKHQKEIFNACLVYTGSHQQDAEDLQSEVLLRAYEKMELNTSGISDYRNWFNRIVLNVHLNKQQHLNRLMLYEDLEEIADLNLPYFRSPYKEIIGKEIQQQLLLSLQKLPPNQAYLTRLYFEGFSYRDIAEKHTITVNNIRKTVQLCRQTLQKDLQNKRQDDCNHPQPSPQFEHLIHVKTKDGSLHYALLYTKAPPQRLEQKIQALRIYLEKHPFAWKRRFSLAEMLASAGHLEAAINQLDLLLLENYHCEKVYLLKVRLLIILKKYSYALNTASSAIANLPLPSSAFNFWKLLSQLRLKDAKDFISLQIRQSPFEISSRLLLLKALILERSSQRAFKESQTIEALQPECLEIFPDQLKGILEYKSFHEAKHYLEDFFSKYPLSLTAEIFQLHFYLADGLGKENEKVKKLFRKLRRSCFWHPDFALIKAKLSVNPKKVLARRIADYPDCALSKHYLAYFTRTYQENLPEITAEEKRHFETVRMIYMRVRS